ncbi:dihydrodipicolinate synthase family protein [Paraburkholderia tropica]|uniref:dihydrodipicolinate synthase family protein n=1 Tax=Paraburkholderia tropica TaxID=92647 RepID=UPI002AB6D418|nr:dihydrodipicolinate synthase family protein [Paraburkholderia tropica]
MAAYKKSDARAWGLENMHGVANVIIPTFTSDLKSLNENGIRHDVDKCREYGFSGTLLVSEVAITLPEYARFIAVAREKAEPNFHLIHHAAFGTLAENIEAAKLAEDAGADFILLGYPANFFATSEQDIYDYTKAFCDATDLGVILFPVPLWGFERVHPAAMSPELIRRLVKDCPNILCVKAEGGIPTPGGFIQTWRNHSHEMVVTHPLEQDAIPLSGILPIQWIGTSNTEFYADTIPRVFKLCREGKFDEAMDIWWKLHPARMAHNAAQQTYAPGARFINRMMWKYQAWLQGFNGGPLRQPTMKVSNANMRLLRDGLKAAGFTPTELPDSEFHVGRNPQ